MPTTVTVKVTVTNGEEGWTKWVDNVEFDENALQIAASDLAYKISQLPLENRIND